MSSAVDVDQSGGLDINLINFVQVLYGLVFLLGLVGNSLVIYVILRYNKMQTVTNLYILNLAIADECFLIGIPFIMTTMGLGSWPFGNVICKIYMTTTSVNQFTSSLLLTVMSADRYIAVCHPITSPTFRTPLIAKIVSLTTWAISFLMIVPIFLYARTQQAQEDTDHEWSAASDNMDYVSPSVNRSNQSIASCNIYWPENELQNGEAAFTIYTTVGPSNKSKEKRRTQHRKVTRLVLTVVTVYVLCWLPYWVSQVSLIFMPPKSPQSPLMVAVFLLAGCLGYSNSAVNPILYAFLSDNFKKSFMKACVCAERREVNKALAADISLLMRGGGGGDNNSSDGGHIEGGEPEKNVPKVIENDKSQPPHAEVEFISCYVKSTSSPSKQIISPLSPHTNNVPGAEEINENSIQSNIAAHIVTALNYSDTIVDTVHQDVDCDRIASKGVKETTHIKNGVLETDL